MHSKNETDAARHPRRRLTQGPGDLRHRITCAAVFAVASVPLAGVELLAKWQRIAGGGMAMAERMAGRLPGGLTVFERLSLLSPDLVVVLLVVPLAVALVAALAPARGRVLAVGLLVATLISVQFVQVRSFGAIGAPMRYNMFITAVRFGLERPDLIGGYLPLRSTAVHALAIALAFWFAALGRRYEQRALGKPPSPMMRHGRTAAVAIALVVVVAVLARPLPAASYEEALLTTSVRALVSGEDAIDRRLAGLSASALVNRYWQIVGARPSPSDARFFGKARNQNVIIMMMETIPADCVDMTGSLDDLPAFKRLRARAFVSRQHYSATPNSSTSNFATLSGWYPPAAASPFVQSRQRARPPTLFWALRSRGYHTALYEPMRARFEDDSDIYRVFGMDQEIVGKQPVDPLNVQRGWSGIAAADSAAFGRMLADIRAWLASGDRFATYFVPEVAHGPWRDPIPGRNSSLMERCRALVAIHDGWMSQIVATLDETRAFDKTLIIITADHGIRTVEEDPRLRPG